MFRHMPVFGLIAALLPIPAMAQDEADVQGFYSSEAAGDFQTLTARLTRLEGGDYDVDLQTMVSSEDMGDGNIRGGCGGGVTGRITLADGKATLTETNEFFNESLPEDASNARACEVSMRFIDGTTLETEELSGCFTFHGAQCNFTGTLTLSTPGS
ncbi:MAG: hypothetical protein Q4G26_14960 [Paracoccus sp. (in: a-proteobacteria)]|nr:hypothetical protein [Paracoccus sp. (in: a-proteobacteria)]